MPSKRRSGFEDRIEADLKKRKITYGYEDTKFHYVVPKSYRPDFRLGDMYIEAKGYHPGIRKYLNEFVHFKKQHPALDIRFLFDVGIPNKLLGTKLTFAGWADKHSIPWAEGQIPEQWIDDAFGTKGKRK